SCRKGFPMLSRLFPVLSLIVLFGAACGGGGGEVTFKAPKKPLETAKIASALTNGKHLDLFLGCKVGCEIYQNATCAGCVSINALEKACGADYRYVEVKLNSGNIAPGKYGMDKFSLNLVDKNLGANLLYESKTASLDIKSATEASYTTDNGG